MFTGIIEEVGKVVSAQRSAQAMRLTIEGQKIFEDMEVGCSISVNGVCLTVTSFTGRQFVADVMPETVNMTTLVTVSSGQAVNLERAMAADGRFGGHMVAGHVDGQGRIRNIRKLDNSVIFTIETTPDVLDYIIYKGSIAVDGASLTVSKREDTYFEISIIPHTIANTILAKATVGTVVNLETDIAGRYIRHFMNQTREESPRQGLSKDWLASKGFI
ncbi:riboflavin synthase [Veillonella criceti]|uniref:Riboflavin synthase n=1 Tax=Veillonella criceti TaxID=103891 RepID=A0A380NHP1_9FIRM|nr:riboflavin synthase [Veillonella criceti]SUP40987.1 Riboflavin synthase alpha chain [Veillonella criceti]